MDLYPTFLVTQRKLSVLEETWVTCILQIGGVLGGIVGGFLSHRFSPKWVAAPCALLMLPFLPLWALPTSWNLLALGSFFFQFFYGCAIGNLGNIMQQICPHPGIRGTFTGIACTDDRDLTGRTLPYSERHPELRKDSDDFSWNREFSYVNPVASPLR